MAAIFYFGSKFKEDHYESFEASGILNTFVQIKIKNEHTIRIKVHQRSRMDQNRR